MTVPFHGTGAKTSTKAVTLLHKMEQQKLPLFIYKMKPQKHHNRQANHCMTSSRDGFLVFFEAFFCVSPSFLRLTALGPFALIVVVGGTGLEIGMLDMMKDESGKATTCCCVLDC